MRSIDGSQRQTAKAAGLVCLFTTAVLIAAQFGINARLMGVGNAEETVKNILAHESLFRLGILTKLVYCAGNVALLTAFYRILKTVYPGLALVAAFWRLLYALVWIFIALNSFTALRLMGSADHFAGIAQLFDGVGAYYVGLLFWSLASTVCSYLWLRSNYIPKSLAAFGLAASAWCVVCTVAFLIFPNFANGVDLWWFDSPMLIFEIVISFWLLFKGIKVPHIQASN